MMEEISMMQRMQPITSLMPTGWREKAKELKAFTRRGDYIQDPEELLRILLLWADLGTYGTTAAFLRTTTDYPMSKVALYKRVKASAEWLQWLVLNFSYENGFLAPKPDFLRRFRVLLTDATKVSKPGSHSADFSLHTLIDLSSLIRVEQYLTDISIGESMTNFNSLKEDDIVLGDRAYGTITSMRWVEEHLAYYIFRLRASGFCLYCQNEKQHFIRFDLTEHLKDWEENKLLEYHLFYRQGKEYYPVRVCALGKTAEAIEEGIKKIKQSNSGKNRAKVTELQSIYNKYMVVITNLSDDISANQILSLYRQRWQIELVFKRLKSIIKYDELQTKNDSTSHAWFWCKLLTAAICETYLQRSAFSPSGQYLGKLPTEVIMVGIRSCLRRPGFAYS